MTETLNPKRPWRLTSAQVVAMRELYADGVKASWLAKTFRCTPGMVSNIVNGISHRDVDGPISLPWSVSGSAPRE